MDEEDIVFLENDALEIEEDEPIEVVIEGTKPVESPVIKKARIGCIPATAAVEDEPIASTSNAVAIPEKPALFIPPENTFRFRETLAYKKPVFTGFQESCTYEHSQVLKPIVNANEEMLPAYDVFNAVCNFEGKFL